MGTGLLSLIQKKNKIFGLLFCIVLALAIYAGYVGSVNALFGHNYIAAFSLSSQSHSGNDLRFAIGDTMIASIDVRSGNFYRLNLYDNNSELVFESAGEVGGSDLKIPVLITPPVFVAGQIYNCTLSVCQVNYPLIGINAFESVEGPFKVVMSRTKLILAATYDSTTHALWSVATLSTDDAIPVENKTVSLYMQPDLNVARNDKGWVYLSQDATDENGTARFDVAINGRGGVYGLEARFAGDDNLAACTSPKETNFTQISPKPSLNVVKVDKVKNFVKVLLKVTDSYGFPLGGRLLSYEALNMGGEIFYAFSDGAGYADFAFDVSSGLNAIDSRISVLSDGYTSGIQLTDRLDLNTLRPFFSFLPGCEQSGIVTDTARLEETFESHGVKAGASMLTSLPTIITSLNHNPARADLPERIAVRFATDEEPEGDITFHFYQNGSTLLASAVAGCDSCRAPDGEGGYFYWWEYWQTLVWNPDYYGGCTLFVNATKTGNALVAEGSTDAFSIDPAPWNLVVCNPEAFCGNALNLSVVLSRSTTYQQDNSSSYFQVTNLAPKIQWTGDTYVVDCGEENSSIEVYLNGSRTQIITGNDGLVQVQADLTSLGSSECLNVTVHLNGTSRFGDQTVTKMLFLTKVNVSDVPSGNGDLTFGYSLVSSENGNRTYIEIPNTITLNVSLFDLQVCNITTSIIAAKLLSRSATNSSGWANITSGTNYVRIRSACQLQPGMASPIADVNHDGTVNYGDISQIISHCNSSLGDSKYDWSCDLNGDCQINDVDINICTADFGKHVVYLTSGNSTGNYTANYDFSGVLADRYVCQNKSTSYFDSQGFSSLPSGCLLLNMSIGGIVECFYAAVGQNASTDNLGIADLTYSWSSEGVYVIQARLPSCFTAVATSMPNSTQVDAPLKIASYFYVLKRPVDFYIDLQCNVSSSLPAYPVPILVTAVDHATQQAIANLQVQINVTDGYSNIAYTNQSGVATVTWQPVSNIVYDVLASCSAVGNYAASMVSRSFDFRWSTTLYRLGGSLLSVTPNTNCTLRFYLKNGTVSGSPIRSMLVSCFINGTYWNGSTWLAFNGNYNGTTSPTGLVSMIWSVPNGNGTYSVHAWFDGNSTWLPSMYDVSVKATSIPMALLLSASPTELAPGTTITLNATIIDATTKLLVTSQNVMVNFTAAVSDGTISLLGTRTTDFTGMAILSLPYPSDGKAHAFKAEIVNCYNGSSMHHGIASNPLSLSICANTTLSLNITRDYTSTKHRIEGYLENGASGISGRSISITINGTSMSPVMTDANGFFSYERDLQPGRTISQPSTQTTTYVIQANYEGDAPINATAYAIALDGTCYAACTTVQRNNKPCYNSTILTVDPRSTEKVVPTKTPDEMRDEAQNTGSLRVTSEFTWQYPWYRTHFILQLEETSLDVGFNPVLPGGETKQWSGLEVFSQLLSDVWEDVTLDFAGVFVSYSIAKGLSLWNLPGGLLAETIKGGVQWGLFFVSLLNEAAHSPKMLAISLASLLMGLIALVASVGEALVIALQTLISSSMMSALSLTMTGMVSLAAPLQVFRTPVDYIESFAVDLPIAVWALARYQGLW